ncbi:hypothetical protein [Pseudomonas sp. PS01298]|uniref:hypothetical protein n=1 Tax=Pseudomonas sp. PS01298 TaxID=2991434 RepID=UPI00249B703A|nr:hypothetical protein [Pseudomonas sp. PS01298]
MSDRFIVVNARPFDGGKHAADAGQNHSKARGFVILDREENKRLSDAFLIRKEAQEECDRRNGR